MNLTEAKSKHCPLSDFRDTGSLKKCHADQCAMWRWKKRYKKINVSTDPHDCTRWVYVEDQYCNQEPEGYCGLAGREE